MQYAYTAHYSNKSLSKRGPGKDDICVFEVAVKPPYNTRHYPHPALNVAPKHMRTPQHNISTISIGVVLNRKEDIVKEIQVSRSLSRYAPDVSEGIIAFESLEHKLEKMLSKFKNSAGEIEYGDSYYYADDPETVALIQSALSDVEDIMYSDEGDVLSRPVELDRRHQGGVVDRQTFATFAELNEYIESLEVCLPRFTLATLPTEPVIEDASWSRFNLEYGESHEGDLRTSGDVIADLDIVRSAMKTELAKTNRLRIIHRIRPRSPVGFGESQTASV